MKHLAITLLLLCTALFGGHLDLISYYDFPDTSLLDGMSEDLGELNYYASSWSPAWNYDVSKRSIVRIAKRTFKKLEKLNSANDENVELLLLLGITYHFGHNLDIEDSWENAVKYYDKAIGLSPRDARPQWFKAMLLAGSGDGTDAINLYNNLLDNFEITHPYFWEDYAFAAHINSMRITSKYAIDMANQYRGGTSEFTEIIQNTLNKHLVELNPDGIYQDTEIWRMSAGTNDSINIINEAFGLKFTIPGEWECTLGGYRNNSTIFTTSLPSTPGITKQISPSITLLMVHQNPDESEVTVIDKFKLRDKFTIKDAQTDFNLSEKSYICSSDTVMLDEGGYQIFACQFSTSANNYRGKRFEHPKELLPQNDGEEPTFFKASGTTPMGFPTPLTFYLLCETSNSASEYALDEFLKYVGSIEQD